MMRRFLCAGMLACLLLTALLPVAAAEAPDSTPRAANACGDGLTWSYADGVLTISGSGKMDDFPDGAPWAAHRSQITRVVFTGGVTYIGAYAFKNYDAITSIDFGSSMYEIGQEAFMGCDGLTTLYMPASFRVFGPSSFQNCRKLTAFHCQGRFPSFKQNSMWDTYATFYYPVEKPWPQRNIDQLEEAFHGRIRFLASDGTDPYPPTEATTEATEETTVETTEETTAATTEATTVPTVSETDATLETFPQTQASTTATTAPATQPQPPAPQEKPSNTGLLLIGGAAVLCLLLGVMLFLLRFLKAMGKKGKFSR